MGLSRFSDYFPESIEYPSPCETMLPLGTLYEYISSTFLNGWINYVDIVAARLVTRYSEHEINVDTAEKFNARSIEEFGCHTSDFHGVNRPLRDDVLILARPQINRPLVGDSDHAIGGSHWWFFWYDMDCSDSAIGRFSTTDADEVVIQRFADHCDIFLQQEKGDPDLRAIVLDPRAFTGWISG